MCATIIAILSYAFQLAGALILLLWSIRKCDANVIKGCFDNQASIYASSDDDSGSFTVIPKEDLQQSSQNVYLNIASFVDLSIGYALAIFITDICISRCCVLAWVIISVFLILVIERFSVCLIAKKMYSADRKVHHDECKPKNGSLSYEITKPPQKNNP